MAAKVASIRQGIPRGENNENTDKPITPIFGLTQPKEKRGTIVRPVNIEMEQPEDKTSIDEKIAKREKFVQPPQDEKNPIKKDVVKPSDETNVLGKNGETPNAGIDNALVEAINDKFHFKPSIGMSIGCKVNGKASPLRGTLQYLGHINDLPVNKRNIVVAGLKLEDDEDLATDGTFLGKKYFNAPQKRGYFVPFKNCVK